MADSLNTPILSKIHQALSRRSLMREMAGTLAVVLASPAAVAASCPTTDDPKLVDADAQLIELGKSLEEVTKRYREAGDKLDPIYDQVKNSYPALPLVMKATESDVEFGLPKPNNGKFYKPVRGGSYDQPGYYTPFHLRELEEFDASRSVKIPVEMHIPVYSQTSGNEFPALYLQSENLILTRRDWPEAQARVDELVAAISRWNKACKRIEARFGYHQACKVADAIGNEQNIVLEQIADIQANSTEGINVKLRAIRTIYAEDEIEFGECTADRLATAVVNHLLKRLEGKPLQEV
jgi:hypothetical protein